MLKHYSIEDFTNIVKQHKTELKELEEQNGKLSHKLLLETFVKSEKPVAKKFSYVIGSMKGEQDLQFKTMLGRLEKAGKKSMVKVLKARKDLPCIDIQECIFLVNSKSGRDRDRDYSYSDYFDFAKKQFISGSAVNFTIDWFPFSFLSILSLNA